MQRRIQIVAVIGVLLPALVAACGSDPTELSGFVRTPLPEVGTVALPDASNGGADFPMRAGADSILVIYFGYTSCPDVCPTTMADLRSALRKLDPDEAERVDVAMTTVDPDRDTDEVITGYVRAFFPQGHGLRTTDDGALRAAADAFGADYAVETTEEGDVEVAHTGHLYAVDEAGRIKVTWAFGTKSDELASDLRLLLESA